MVATVDRTIDPDLERMYAKRAQRPQSGGGGSQHAVYILT
jgi:hypothetical protein